MFPVAADEEEFSSITRDYRTSVQYFVLLCLVCPVLLTSCYSISDLVTKLNTECFSFKTDPRLKCVFKVSHYLADRQSPVSL